MEVISVFCFCYLGGEHYVVNSTAKISSLMNTCINYVTSLITVLKI